MSSNKKKGEKKSKKQLEIEARLAKLEAARIERTRKINRMLKFADEKSKFCDDRIEEALACENSDDEYEVSNDGDETKSQDSGFHIAKIYGVKTTPEKRVVKSLIAMDPEQQETVVCDYLDEHEARWGPNSRTAPKLTKLQRLFRFFNPGPNSTYSIDRYFRACLDGDRIRAKKYIENGGDPTVTDEDGRNGAYYACIEGNIDILQLMYKHRVDLQPEMKLNGFTPFHLCATGRSRDHRACAAWLITRSGFNIDPKDHANATPLMRACQCGNISFVKMVLEAGAEINACDDHRWTPFHYACYHGHTRCVDALLEEGVKYSAKDEDGNTGLDWALRQEFEDICELIIDYDQYKREQRREARRGR